MTVFVDPIRPTTVEAIKLAKTLLRSSRYGAIAVLDLATKRPAASRVGVATDVDGTPIILVSGLTAHTRALRDHPPCSLLLGVVGKGDPLAHPRITLHCTAELIDRASPNYSRVKQRYLNHNPKAALYADLGDFVFFRLNTESGSLNGGFGKAFNLTHDDLISSTKASENIALFEQKVLDGLNQTHTEAIACYARSLKAEGNSWKLVGIDPDGFDLAGGDRLLRSHFPSRCDSIESASITLEMMLQGGA